MKQDRNEEGRVTQQGRGLGTVTPEMVQARAREIAVINGRGKNQVLEGDLAQARRELTGDERLNPPRTAAEKIGEEERVAGLQESGKAPTVTAPDEQTVSEKLVEEGVQEAEHDQMIKATRDSLKRDKS